jgi:hypothetical protein
MLKKAAALALIIPFLAIRTVSAQGIDTKASKDDWEEINFDFNSSVLVDGFPSLLRISALLQMNPTYKVKVEGHTDPIGSSAYNEKLGLARATAVRDFLVKYGSRAAQIEVSSRGKDDPKYGPGKPVMSATDEARWMDRRVALTVTDGQGRTIGAGGAGDAIRALDGPGASPDCCNEVLHRLDKLDALEALLKQLMDQNNALKDQLAGLKQEQDAMRDRIAALGQGPDFGRGTQAAGFGQNGQPGGGVGNGAGAGAGNATPATPLSASAVSDIANAVATQLDNNKPPRFEVLGMNVGSTGNGNATFTGKGRYFAPFGEHYAFQSEGEYFYSSGQREGQFDVGLVDRVDRFQAGLFASFKHVNLVGDQNGGTLGQGAVTLEYLFKWGKIGAYGTAAFLNDAVVNSVPLYQGSALVPDVFLQTYLRVVNQAGMNVTGPLFGKSYFEGNVGFLKTSTSGDRMGGTLRFIFPVSNKIAFTLEGGVNETLVGPGNTGRVVAGMQFGNFARPKDFLTTAYATPVQIPRIRYETLTREVRTGVVPPVANAGPDQTLPGAATVTLDGSGSYDPEGGKLTYQWAQTSGPAVTLSSANSVTTTFSALAGQVYIFQLTVHDSFGLQATSIVSVTTAAAAPPQILLFTATPNSVLQGQAATLGWQVINADTVTITQVGNVALTGSIQVSPQETTVYQLTATKGALSVSTSVTVTITLPAPVPTPAGAVTIVSYSDRVLADGTTQLYCVTKNAVSILLNGITFPYTLEAVIQVDPPVPTQYPCVATGADGTVVSQTLTVQ